SVLAAPALTGVAAGVLFALTDPSADPIRVAWSWFFACGLGMMIVGAFALSVRRPRRGEGRQIWLQFLAGQGVLLLGVSVIRLRPGTPGLFMLYPFLIAGALSHRELGGICAIAITTLMVWLSTYLGRGAAAVADLTSMDRILLMQILLASMVFT